MSEKDSISPSKTNVNSSGPNEHNWPTSVEVLGSSQESPSENEIGWHIDAINAREAWIDYTGKGVIAAVVDTGWQNYNHSDLDDNIRFDLADPLGENGESHGQGTIGLVGAEANGVGAVGVAYNVDLVPEKSASSGIRDATAYADVINNSWRYGYWNNQTSYLEEAVRDGRNGLGSVVVFAAGNDRESDLSSNLLGYSNSPYSIAVAAMDPDETSTYFSNPGSSLLVTAPGISLKTTYGETGYTNGFRGTSGSAPIVTGGIALIIEANEDLGYRDIQNILAYSTQHNDSNSSSWAYNGANNWNGGGLHFSHDHGFGLVDIRAAVRLAETWTEQSTYENLHKISIEKTLNITLPDNGSTYEDTINVSGGDIVIETVEAIIDIDNHGNVGELKITLISPNGTEAVLLDTPGNGDSIISFDWSFTANNFRGEYGQGDWTLKVTDTVTGNVGVLADWTLVLNGSSVGDDTYFYSDDFSNSAAHPQSTLLSDTNGGSDTINASMVTTGVVINLNPGSVSNIDGTNLTIDSGTVIENAFGGDGNDIIVGNEYDNVLWGGRGNDWLVGGSGNDTLWYGDLPTFYNYSFGVSNDVTITAIGDSVDTGTDYVVDIESFQFGDYVISYDDLQDQVTAMNGIPVAFDDVDPLILFMDKNTSFEIHESVLLANDFDFDGDALTITSVGGALNASVFLDTHTGTITYTPDFGYDGLMNFEYTISDGALTSTATVTVDVINHTPTTGYYNKATLPNQSASILIANLLDTSSDEDGDTLSFVGFNETSYFGGSVQQIGDTLIYTPVNGYSGWDTIQYTITDGTDEQFGNINIVVNTPPSIGDDYFHTTTDTSFDFSSEDIALNDYDADGDDLYIDAFTFTAMNGTISAQFVEGGGIVGSPSYIYTYTPDAGFTGQDIITYEVWDIAPEPHIGTIYIDVYSSILEGTSTTDNITGTSGDDLIYGYEGIDVILGGEGNDNIYGGDETDWIGGGKDNDIIYGESGSDLLVGNEGDDILYGGEGGDYLLGGLGADTLTGNSGADTFIFQADDLGTDTVSDFNKLEGDTLDLSAVLTQYDPLTEAVSDFITAIDFNTDNLFIAVDLDGQGTEHSWTLLTTLEGAVDQFSNVGTDSGTLFGSLYDLTALHDTGQITV